VLKLLKILYEQVILDDEDLQGIAERYAGVGALVEGIISDFI
jgi:hypothetical protein